MYKLTLDLAIVTECYIYTNGAICKRLDILKMLIGSTKQEKIQEEAYAKQKQKKANHAISEKRITTFKEQYIHIFLHA